MDDPVLFRTFVTATLNVAPPRVEVELISFISTFRELMNTSEYEFNEFIKTTSASNTGRAAAGKIVFPSEVILMLKGLMFELKDRETCNALPNLATLQGIDRAQLLLLRRNRSDAMALQAITIATLPDMKVPKLTSTNYDAFHTAFFTLVSRQKSVHGIPLSYLLRDGPQSVYHNGFPSRSEKLAACLELRGAKFNQDSQALYSLYVEHIGTTGMGSSTINAHKRTRNGRQCYLDLNSHHRNTTYLDNLATAANATISAASYHGQRRNFTLESYYNIMTTGFNDLSLAGPAHTLNEVQKINKFETGLKQPTALNFSIMAKSQWDALPAPQRTFDSYYNLFSPLINKHNTLATPTNQNRNIHNINSGRGQGRGGRGNGGRTYQRGGRGGRGRGRGRGRGYNGGRGTYGSYNNNQMTVDYSNFQPEARVYAPHYYRGLTNAQKTAVTALKQQAGWINSNTPPAGFVIDTNTGFATPSQAIISAIRTANIQSHQSNYNQNQGGTIIQLPPRAAGNPPSVPPIIDTGTSQAGSQFGRSGQRSTGNASVSTVSLANGQQYTGQLFDILGRPVN